MDCFASTRQLTAQAMTCAERAMCAEPRAESTARSTAMKILRIVTVGFHVGDRSRGRFATPADFPLHDCSPYSHVHARRERLGFVHRSRAVFRRPCPNPNIPIRNFCIAPRSGGVCRTEASGCGGAVQVVGVRLQILRARRLEPRPRLPPAPERTPHVRISNTFACPLREKRVAEQGAIGASVIHVRRRLLPNTLQPRGAGRDG
jgi:hypothetical protein